MTHIDAPTAADLEHDAHKAEALAYQLEQRVLDGDDQINHDQISEARSRSAFLRLRAEGRRRRDEREAAEQRRADARALSADVLALAPTDPLRETSTAARAAAKAVGAAFAKYLAAVRAYDERATALQSRADLLGLSHGDDVLEGVSVWSTKLRASGGDGLVHEVQTSYEAARSRALERVIRGAMNSLPAEDGVRL